MGLGARVLGIYDPSRDACICSSRAASCGLRLTNALCLLCSQWVKRGGRSMSSISPTAVLACPCGQLAPEGLNKVSDGVRGRPASQARWHLHACRKDAGRGLGAVRSQAPCHSDCV